MKPIDISKLNEALMLINEHLILDDAPATEIVVCGGSALIATGLFSSQRSVPDDFERYVQPTGVAKCQ